MNPFVPIPGLSILIGSLFLAVGLAHWWFKHWATGRDYSGMFAGGWIGCSLVINGFIWSSSEFRTWINDPALYATAILAIIPLTGGTVSIGVQWIILTFRQIIKGGPVWSTIRIQQMLNMTTVGQLLYSYIATIFTIVAINVLSAFLRAGWTPF